MKQTPIQRLAFASLFLALSIVLPLLISPIPEIGQRLLPMHIPVLLCGFFCGWKYGFIVGVLAPLLKTLFPPAPPIYPIGIAMSLELGTYGLITALFYQLLPKKNYFTYLTLIIAMVCGRVIYGIVISILISFEGRMYTLSLFVSQTVIQAIPGIILQILLIPAIVLSLKKLTTEEVSYA
jgi:thiamine transporter ThiT